MLCPCLQALAFGGGLSATITGGRFSNITSNLGILVLARSRLYISDTILANNSLSKGALYVSHNGSLFALSNVTLSGNTAEAEGTALYVNHGAAEMLNSTFSSNTAHSGGGAVHVKAGGTLNLINTTFDGNVAGNGSEAFGGALYVMDSHVSATNCTFANNVATRGAGAIYLGMATPPNATDRCQYRDLPRRLVIKGSTFQGNVAPIGGALAVFYAAVFIHNSTFTVNRARILQVESLKLAKVLQQSSEYYTLGVGGAIYADNAVVDVQHSYFTSNVAVMDGGECTSVGPLSG
jgi:predicted outer membrane repeat protein